MEAGGKAPAGHFRGDPLSTRATHSTWSIAHSSSGQGGTLWTLASGMTWMAVAGEVPSVLGPGQPGPAAFSDTPHPLPPTQP